jgi:hypothetical protein
MHNALTVFETNISNATNLNSIYEHLNKTISASAPISFDDILRLKFVNSVSAFDKLLHDIIRIGILQIFQGTKTATPKYLSEQMPFDTYIQLVNTSTPPPEFVFEKFILQKLKTMSFQTPDKVAEGLSFIWDEKYKWSKISKQLAMDEKTVKTTLKLIADRRNCIVHEADMDPMTHQKYPISKKECDDVTDFLLNTGKAIATLQI